MGSSDECNGRTTELDNTNQNGKESKNGNTAFNIEHFCAPVIHPSTGKMITKYAELANDPEMREIWTTAFGKEWGGLTQGDKKTGSKGTNSLHAMSHAEIKLMPADRTVTYAKIVVDYRAQKADPHRVRITAGGIRDCAVCRDQFNLCMAHYMQAVGSFRPCLFFTLC